MRLAFVAVFSFIAGIAARDTYIEAQAAPVVSCKPEREAAERYAAFIAHVLNGGGLRTSERIVACYVRYKRST